MYVSRGLSSFRVSSGQARASGMFQLRTKMQIHFFDRKIIRTNWGRINRDPLQRAGNLVRMIARSSIKRRTSPNGKPSPAGTPPRSRKPGTSPPFKQIYSIPFRLGTSVIVGMVGYGGRPAVPGLHEHGGVARRKVYSFGSQRRLKSGRYGKQKTIYKTMTVKYPQRAFMEPALLRARSRLPEMWKNTLPNMWQSSVGVRAA